VGPIDECFESAYNLCLSNKNLRYVEGFILELHESEGCRLIYHAWGTDEAGNIYDPRGPGERSYWGVEFDLDFVTQTNLARKKYGVIFNKEGCFPLLSGKEEIPPLYPHPAEGWKKAMGLGKRVQLSEKLFTKKGL